MSRPKPFLEPDDVYARLRELERTVKALATTPRTAVTGITAASVDTLESLLSSGGWVDLTTPGPSVTATVGPSGIAVVMAFCQCDVALTFPSPSQGLGVMGYTIDSSGGTPTAVRQIQTGINGGMTGTVSSDVEAVQSIVRLETLTPGAHTFKMRFRMLSGVDVAWSNRTLVILPL